MPHDRHKHRKNAHGSDAVCCGSDSDRMCGNSAQVEKADAAGRNFLVNGLDCAEEVSILNKALGPEVGGAEHLAFDVLNGRMTVLDSARSLPDERIITLIGKTGMTASLWDAGRAEEDREFHRWFRCHRSFGGSLVGFPAFGVQGSLLA